MDRPIPLCCACLVLLLPGPLEAAGSPVPDRPFEAKSGLLISSGSLEIEAGGLWANGFHAPIRLKYGLGKRFEPRLSADLAGVGSDSPKLAVEGKIGIFRTRSTGLAAYLVSALPIEGEPWTGTARVLYSTRHDHLLATLNGGLDLAGREGGVAIADVPLVALIGAQLGRAWSGYGEGSLVVDEHLHDVVLDAGLRWTTTDILTVDGAAGWRLEENVPFVTLGLTVNLGNPGG
jgi:hypothetical protein